MARSVFFIFALLLVTTPCAATMEVESIAYCKVNRNRIMIFEFTGLPSDQDMKNYLEEHQPMHTDRRMTAAYFFPKGSKMPQAGFSSCRSIQQANNLLYRELKIDPWEFAYMHSFSGERVFVNCLTNGNHDLCR